MNIHRNRKVYILIVVLVLLLGLFTRSQYMFDLPFMKEYSGDTIWAMMVFFIWGTIFNKTESIKVGLMAIVFCCSIEFSQLYHATWIDALRMYKLGGLVLGYGFKFTDLICYLIGIIAGFAIERGSVILKGKGAI